jgi:hypothetical protein
LINIEYANTTLWNNVVFNAPIGIELGYGFGYLGELDSVNADGESIYSNFTCISICKLGCAGIDFWSLLL